MTYISTISVILFVIFILLLGWRLRKRERLSHAQCSFLRKRWGKILNEYDKDPSKAIIEADKLLEWALGKVGYRGTLGEKLKKVGDFFPNLNDIWFAHKLRNKLVHEISYELGQRDAMRAMTAYKKAINTFL